MSRIGFLFPGQGAQHVGMGKQLAEEVPEARRLFDRASAVLGFDLAAKCFEGPAEELDSTVISQPALFVTSLAALEWLRSERPQVVLACERTAGLSLGEYTALVFAGVMQFEDALAVVQRRGEAMQEAADRTPSGMVSLLLLTRDVVENICREAAGESVLQIANYLCPGNIVVSGHNRACERAAELAEEAGGRAMPLAVAGAFHTELMQPADLRVSEALAGCPLAPPEIPVVSNVDAVCHEDSDTIRELLVRQVISPVLWEDSIRNMLDSGIDEFYEIGPGKVLRGLLKRIDRSVPCESISGT